MSASAGDSGQERAVVVLIEDHERSRRLFRELLELHGFAVRPFEAAEPGLESIRADLPSLVVLDVQLPGMDGVTALGLLRADPATAALPVVAVTAYAMRGERERFLAAGFDAYISKPIDVRTFVPQLLALLDGRPS